MVSSGLDSRKPVPLPITDCPGNQRSYAGGDTAGIQVSPRDLHRYNFHGDKIQIDFLTGAVRAWFSVIHQKFGRSGGKAIGAKPLLKWSDDGAVWMPQNDFDFVRVGFPELKV